MVCGAVRGGLRSCINLGFIFNWSVKEICLMKKHGIEMNGLKAKLYRITLV